LPLVQAGLEGVPDGRPTNIIIGLNASDATLIGGRLKFSDITPYTCTPKVCTFKYNVTITGKIYKFKEFIPLQGRTQNPTTRTVTFFNYNYDIDDLNTIRNQKILQRIHNLKKRFIVQPTPTILGTRTAVAIR